MMRFKVGDKVRIIKFPVQPHKIGDVGTITFVDCSGVKVKIKNHSNYYYFREIQMANKRYIKKPTGQIRHILSRHISNKKKMELIAEVVASNQT